jgi:hypothetical protein
MTPIRRKTSSPERAVHLAILQYLRLAMPRAMVVHVANQVDLSGANIARAIAKNKDMGMVVGFPDLMVLPFSNLGPLFFEIKAPKGRVSEAQGDVHDALRGLGYRVAVVRSVDEVKACLTKWAVWSAPAAAVELRGAIK